MRQAQERQTRYANLSRREVTFKIGDKVLLATSHLRLAQAENASCKLQPRFHGPYKITEVISLVAYRLDLPKEYKAHPVVHISHLKEFLDGSEQFPHRKSVTRPPPPIVMEETDEKYNLIEEFLNHRINKRRKAGQQAEFLINIYSDIKYQPIFFLKQDMLPELYNELVSHYVSRSGAQLDPSWFAEVD
jgi:hypothetical protein